MSLPFIDLASFDLASFDLTSFDLISFDLTPSDLTSFDKLQFAHAVLRPESTMSAQASAGQLAIIDKQLLTRNNYKVQQQIQIITIVTISINLKKLIELFSAYFISIKIVFDKEVIFPYIHVYFR